MPVKAAKNRKSATLTCNMPGCTVSATFPSRSPAAPELTACEEAGKAGWAYDFGFHAMLVGHTVLCPEHAKKVQA
jgi:hypothetical protein